MSGQQRLGFAANGLANLVVGAATLGYAVIVPAVVIRRFGSELYGTWYLAFQVATYVVLLDLGSQYVVTNESATPSAGPRAARVATAAMVSQAVLALAVLIGAMAWAGLTGQLQLAGLITVLGAGALVSLLASTIRAWFGGLQRAHLPAVWLVTARLAALGGLAVALAAQSSLLAVTVAVAVPQLVVHAGLLVWARRPPSPWARPDRAAFALLARRSGPLALWTLCGVLIGGIDVFVVRGVAASEVGRYAIALPLLAIPAGIVTAAVAAWIPRVTRAEAEGPEGGRDPTLVATTVTAAALAIGAIPFIGYADEIVRLWAGPGDWRSAATYLKLLYLASCLRFVFLPWAVLIIARGEQRTITLAPITEAAINVAASVLLGFWLGAVGVALGTLAGAMVASVLYLGWAVPRTADCGIAPSDLVRAAAAAWPPVVAASALAVITTTHSGTIWRTVAAVVASGVAVWWLLARARRAPVPVPQLEPS